MDEIRDPCVPDPILQLVTVSLQISVYESKEEETKMSQLYLLWTRKRKRVSRDQFSWDRRKKKEVHWMAFWRTVPRSYYLEFSVARDMMKQYERKWNEGNRQQR